MMRKHDDEFELPAEIREGLAGLYRPVGGAGAGMNGRDGALLAAARRAGEGARAARLWRKWGAAGVAAAVVLSIGVLWNLRGGEHGTNSHSYVRTGDIRDAYYLARQIKDGDAQTLGGNWDANADGTVNADDVRVLALAAVKLNAGSAGQLNHGQDVASIGDGTEVGLKGARP
jgi:hypothetical protein